MKRTVLAGIGMAVLAVMLTAAAASAGCVQRRETSWAQ